MTHNTTHLMTSHSSVIITNTLFFLLSDRHCGKKETDLFTQKIIFDSSKLV